MISISCSKHDLFEKISSEQNFITDINKLYIEIKAYFLDELARTKSEILLLLYIILVDARIKNSEVKIVYDFLIKQFIFNKNIFSF